MLIYRLWWEGRVSFHGVGGRPRVIQTREKSNRHFIYIVRVCVLVLIFSTSEVIHSLINELITWRKSRLRKAVKGFAYNASLN